MKYTVQIEFDSVQQLKEFAEWADGLDAPIGYTTTEEPKTTTKKTKAKKGETQTLVEPAKKEAPAPTEEEWTDAKLKEFLTALTKANPNAIVPLRAALAEKKLSDVYQIPAEERDAFVKELQANAG